MNKPVLVFLFQTSNHSNTDACSRFLRRRGIRTATDKPGDAATGVVVDLSRPPPELTHSTYLVCRLQD